MGSALSLVTGRVGAGGAARVPVTTGNTSSLVIGTPSPSSMIRRARGTVVPDAVTAGAAPAGAPASFRLCLERSTVVVVVACTVDVGLAAPVVVVLGCPSVVVRDRDV